MPWKNVETRKAWEEKNKERRKKYQSEWYQKNKKRISNKQCKTRKKRQRDFFEYKKTLSCAKCGFSHPAALDFHHINGEKSFNISEEVRNKPFELLKEEIDKCIILCANCHRILHYEENKWD